MKIMVTGGAGFIGSHFVEKLSKDNDVIVFDHNGKGELLKGLRCEAVKGDILDSKVLDAAFKDVDECYHLAADAGVKESYENPATNFEINCKGTLNVLEACRKNDVKKFIFTSSSAVYGNAELPTPEIATIKPISIYGAGKAASENIIMSYSHLYGLKSTILRYANIIGPNLTHGVFLYFYKKLMENPKELEILGDGNQIKSYIHVKDCVEASIFAKEHTKSEWDVFNVGSEEQINVKDIADFITNFMGLKNVKYKFAGGKIGWLGDIPKMLLSIEKLKKLGWKPKYSIKEAMTDTLRYLRGN